MNFRVLLVSSILGLASGLLSQLIVSQSSIFYIPGIIFAIFLLFQQLILFKTQLTLNIKNLSLFFLIISVGYMTLPWLFTFFGVTHSLELMFVLTNVVGTVFVVLGYSRLYNIVYYKIFSIFFISTLLTVLWISWVNLFFNHKQPSSSDYFGFSNSFYPYMYQDTLLPGLFIMWHTGMIMFFGIMGNQKIKRT